MQVTKPVQKTDYVIDKIICNMCGKTFEHDKDNGMFNADFLSVRKHWGYGSTKKDGDIHEFDLCEPCYDKLIAKFKIAPKSYDGGMF